MQSSLKFQGNSLLNRGVGVGNPKIHREMQKTMDSQSNPKQKNTARDMLSGLKLYHPAIVKKQHAASTKTKM